LLEGLEVSEVSFSYLSFSNDVFRIDSNFFLKEFLCDENKILDKKHNKLKELSRSVLSFGAYSLNNFIEYKQKGIPFIRGVNIKKGIVDFSDMIYIDEKAHKLLWKSEVKPYTVLLSMSGTLGDVAIATEKWNYPINSNQDIAKINFDNKEIAVYVYLFLLTKYGQNYIKREARGSVQQHVFLSQIEQFEIPIFSKSFNEILASIIEKSENKIITSKQTYTRAEEILLEELGLKDFKPSNEPVNIKSFKDSFLSTGRLDAEYYQKKYEKIINYIERNTRWDYLKNLTIYINNGNQPPYSEKGKIRFFSQKWIKDRSIDYSFLKNENEPRVEKSFFEIPKNRNSLVTKGDILFYSVGANLGYCHNYLGDEPIAVGSFINIIRANKEKVNEIYLGIVLNSFIGRMQAEREKSGVAQPYIYAKNLRLFKIPLIETHKQQDIAELIEESFTQKKQSETLLETAKRAVEIAIEDSEEKAIEYIKNNVSL